MANAKVDEVDGVIIIDSRYDTCENMVNDYGLAHLSTDSVFGGRCYIAPNLEFGIIAPGSFTYNDGRHNTPKDRRAIEEAKRVKQLTTDLLIEALKSQGVDLKNHNFLLFNSLNDADIHMYENGGIIDYASAKKQTALRN